MQNLPNQLSQPAQFVLEMAREITKAPQATRPEHILYALLQSPASDAAATLKTLGVDPHTLSEQARAAILAPMEESIVTGATSASEWSDSAQRVIKSANRLSQAQTGGLSTRHLLLGLLEIPSRAQELLLTHNLELARVAAATVSAPNGGRSTLAAQTTERRAKVGRAVNISAAFWILLTATIVSGWLAWSPLIPNRPFAVFLFVICGWITSVCLHEFGHAITAYWFGDDSVVAQGYLTLNPLRYSHPLLSIALPLFFLLQGGIGLPGGAVYINHERFRHGWQSSLVSLAGPIASSLCVLLLWLPYRLASEASLNAHPEFWAGWTFLLFLEVTSVLLNLTPLPPLDGFNLIFHYLPPWLQNIMAPIRQFGFLLLFIIFSSENPVGQGFWAMAIRVMTALQIDFNWVSYGRELFQFWQTTS